MDAISKQLQMDKEAMMEQSQHYESQPQTQEGTNGVCMTQQDQAQEERQQVIEKSSRFIYQPRDVSSLSQIIEKFMSRLEIKKEAEQHDRVFLISRKQAEESEMRVAEFKKRLEEEEKRKLAPVFEAFGGTVGQRNQTRCGIWALSHFVTADYPKLNSNSTVVVRIGNKDYTSKPYLQWLTGTVTMIPLQQGPTSNVQIDILDVPKLDCPSINSLYMFGKVEGQTQIIKLCLDDGKIRYKNNVNSQDLFFSVAKGAPVMMVYKGKPAICCLKDDPQKNTSQKFVWTFKDLNKENMQRMIYLKSEISKLKDKLDKLQTELDSLTSCKSYISSNIFSNNGSEIIINAFRPYIIPQEISKQYHRQLKELKNLKINYQSKETMLVEKLEQFCSLNNIANVPSICQLLQCSVQQDKYIGKYSKQKAIKKFVLYNNGGNQAVKQNFLYYFVRRAFYNMKYVASWPKKRHVLNYSNFLKEQIGQNFYFSYETLMCECGCKENGQHFHSQRMKKKALDKPLTFMIAMLDAIIQFEQHSLIHNDIQFKNFIYYDHDFLLGDFDMSCFIKNGNNIASNNGIEQDLNRLNQILIDRNKLIKMYLQKNQQQINIFFMHTEGQLDKKERSDETLNRLEKTMSKSHQTQVKKLVEVLFSDSDNYTISNHRKTINEMLRMFDSPQISASYAYRKIMSWAQEKRQKQSLEDFIKD